MQDFVIGVIAGLIAGIPQVVLTQVEAWLLPMSRERADIGTRFVERVAEKTDAGLERHHHWLLAGVFHFGYAAWWASFTRRSRNGAQPSRTSVVPCWRR